MRELRARAGLIMKVLCLVLAALVVCQLAGIVRRWNPFRGATVPELPSLTTAATNRPSAGTHQTNLVAATAGKGTNNPTRQPSTNSPLPVATGQSNSMARSFASNDVMIQGVANTNSLASATPVAKGTNLIVPRGIHTGADEFNSHHYHQCRGQSGCATRKGTRRHEFGLGAACHQPRDESGDFRRHHRNQCRRCKVKKTRRPAACPCRKWPG